MNEQYANDGVVCRVSECRYHTTSDCCTASRIEVCNCADCVKGEKDTFCSTYCQRD